MNPLNGISTKFTSLTTSYPGILLDAYGVFWGGNAFGLLPGAKDAMEKLVSSGKIVGILSNTTQLAEKEMQKLRSHGLVAGQHFHFLVTSGEVARALFLKEKLPFATPKKTFWLFGGQHPKYFSHEGVFQETKFKETQDLGEADFIYISIPHLNGEDQTDPELFREHLEKLKAFQLPMVCPNPDRFAQEGNPPQMVVRQGSIAEMYEKMGGKVFYIGKPHAPAYLLAMRHFEKHALSNPNEILMIGDTPETDVRGARAHGMPSALILKTGVMAERISQQGLEQAIEQLDPLDRPDYYIERLQYAL